MLSTNEKAHTPLGIQTFSSIRGELVVAKPAKEGYGQGNSFNPYYPQHLYILSDDPIQVGDWIYESDLETINRAGQDYVRNIMDSKIIATTDSSLSHREWVGMVDGEDTYEEIVLPQPSPQFIEKYVEQYNKGNQITEVLVEYERGFKHNEFMEREFYNISPKVNPKDNTITIKKVKDTYTQEEVDELLDRQTSITTAQMLEKYKGYISREELIRLVRESRKQSFISVTIEQWIKENVK